VSMKLFPVCWLLASLLTASFAYGAAPPSPLEEERMTAPVLVRMVRDAMEHVEDYRASWVQVTKVPEQPRRIAIGTLRVKKPRQVRLDLETPQAVVYTGNGGVLKRYDPASDTIIIEDLDSSTVPEEVRQLMEWEMPDPEVRKDYYAKEVRSDKLAGRPVHVLTVRPRGKRGEVTREIWIDAETRLPCRFVFDEGGDLSVTVTLAGAKTNTGLEESYFRLEPGPDTTVEDRRAPALPDEDASETTETE